MFPMVCDPKTKDIKTFKNSSFLESQGKSVPRKRQPCAQIPRISMAIDPEIVQTLMFTTPEVGKYTQWTNGRQCSCFLCQRRSQENIFEFILVFLRILEGIQWCCLFMLLTEKISKCFKNTQFVIFWRLNRLAFPLEVAQRRSPRGVNFVISCVF